MAIRALLLELQMEFMRERRLLRHEHDRRHTKQKN